MASTSVLHSLTIVLLRAGLRQCNSSCLHLTRVWTRLAWRQSQWLHLTIFWQLQVAEAVMNDDACYEQFLDEKVVPLFLSSFPTRCVTILETLSVYQETGSCSVDPGTSLWDPLFDFLDFGWVPPVWEGPFQATMSVHLALLSKFRKANASAILRRDPESLKWESSLVVHPAERTSRFLSTCLLDLIRSSCVEVWRLTFWGHCGVFLSVSCSLNGLPRLVYAVCLHKSVCQGARAWWFDISRHFQRIWPRKGESDESSSTISSGRILWRSAARMSGSLSCMKVPVRPGYHSQIMQFRYQKTSRADFVCHFWRCSVVTIHSDSGCRSFHEIISAINV